MNRRIRLGRIYRKPEDNFQRELAFCIILLMVITFVGQWIAIQQANRIYELTTLDHKNTYLSSDWLVEGSGIKQP